MDTFDGSRLVISAGSVGSTIYGGPDKSELFFALGTSSERPHHIGFKLTSDAKTVGRQVEKGSLFVNVVVTGIEQEDNSGNSFNIRGYLRKQEDDRWVTTGIKVAIYYTTKPQGAKICGRIKLAD